MSAPTPSKLDHQQCIQASFDETTGALRVNATLTADIIPPPGLEVSILSTFDNIAIRNTNNDNELLINPDGSINVNLETASIEIGKVDQGNAGTESWLVDITNIVPVSQSGTWNINNIAGTISLPTGAATSANQSTEITALNTINTTLGSPFQSGGSIGNTSFIATQTTGSNLHVNVDNFPATVAVTQSTNPWIVSGSVAFISPQHVILDSGSVTFTNSSISVIQSTNPWIVNGSGFTQPISGTITANIGTTGGLALDSSLSTINTTVSGLLTDTQLRATPVPISGTITANQGTSPWVVSGTITTSPNVNVHDGSGNSISSTTGSLNVDVTNTVPVSQSGTWNINNISGTISLPTGAATSTNQSTIISDLGTINTTLGSPMQQTGGTVTANAGTGTFTVSDTTTHTDLATINTTLGSPMQNSGGSVTANIGTTNGLVLDTTVSGLQVAQGSTTSGQHGELIQGAVTTSAPSYSNGQTDPLSLTTAGALRVDGSGVTQPVSGTVTANAGTGTFVVSDATTHTDLSTINTTLGSPFQAGGSIGNTSFTATQATGSNLHTVVDSGTITTITNPVAVTQSGTWNLNNISGTVSLPTGASTASNQTGGSQKTQIVDGSGNVIASTSNALNVDVTNTVTTKPQSGTLTDASGTATNTSTQIFAANTNRKYLLIFNPGTLSFWINFTTAATAASPSIQIVGGSYFIMENNFISTEAINIIRNTANTPFVAKQG